MASPGRNGTMDVHDVVGTHRPRYRMDSAGRAPDADGLRLTVPLRGPIWALTTATLPDGTVVVAAGDSNGRLTWWNGVSGELIGDAMSETSLVVRSMAAVTLPDGRVRFATGGSQGTVQLWDGARGVTTGKPISSATGPVWSMAALTLPGPRAVLFTGEDDGLVRRWDVETGEPAGEPFGDYLGAVRAMTTGAPVDGRPTVVTGGDDGIVRCWDAETGQPLGPPLDSDGGAVWGLTVARMPSGSSIVASAGNNAVLSRWDDSGTRLGAPIVVGPGSLTAVVAVTLQDGRVALICGDRERVGDAAGDQEPCRTYRGRRCHGAGGDPDGPVPRARRPATPR